MNRYLFPALFLAFILTLAPAFAEAPDKVPEAFNTPVTVDTGPAGMPLDAVLRSLVESIGWVAMTRDVPDDNVVVRMPETPFFEAWNLVFSLYASDLGYAALPGGVMVVGPQEIISGQFPNALLTNTSQPERSEGPEVTTLELLDTSEERLQEAAKLFPAKTTYAVFPTRRLLVVRAEPAAMAQVRRVLEVAGLISPPESPRKSPRLPHVLNVPNLPDDVLQTLRDSFPFAQLRYVASSQKLVVRNLDDREVEVLRSMIDELLAPTQEGTKANKPAPDEQPEDRVYKLSSITPDDASRLISFVAPGARVLVIQSVEDAILVKAPPKLHAIIAENLERYEALARAKKRVEEKADKTDSNPLTVASFPLNGRPAEALIEALHETFPEAKVVPTDDALIVKATPAVLKQIENLLQNLTPPEKEEDDKTPADEQGAPPSIRTIYTTNYAAPKDLLLLAQSTGAFPEDVTPVVDERTTDIVLVGTEDDVAKAAALLAELDRPVPQVELRVQIHQVDSSSARRLGIDLNAVLAPFSVSLNPGGLQIGYELGGAALSSLTAVLNTLESKGAAKTLVDTRFLAQDHNPVRLKSGGKLTVLTGGGSNGNDAQPKPMSVDYGLEVELTPEIALADDTVTVDVRTNLGGRPVEGALGTIDIPQKEFEDYVRIANGQSVVLGGLITTTESNSTSSSPLVSWIPLIGDLFTQRTNESSSSELLIILTANILKPSPDPKPDPGMDKTNTEGGVGAEHEHATEEPLGDAAPSTDTVTPAPPAVPAAQASADAQTPAGSQTPAAPPNKDVTTKAEAVATATPPSPAEADVDPAPSLLLVGDAEVPFPYDPLPPRSVFTLRTYPAATPTYGFSLVLPSSTERLCLRGVRIESSAGKPLLAQMRSRTLSGDRNCIDPGSLIVGSLVLNGPTPAARIYFIFEDSSHTYVVRRDLTR